MAAEKSESLILPFLLSNFFDENKDFGNIFFNFLFEIINYIQSLAYYDLLYWKVVVFEMECGLNIDLSVFENGSIIVKNATICIKKSFDLVQLEKAEGHYLGNLKYYTLTEDDRIRLKELKAIKFQLGLK